jgi:hypothetical protein
MNSPQVYSLLLSMWFPTNLKIKIGQAFSSHQRRAWRYLRRWIAMKIAHTTTEALISITNGPIGDFEEFAMQPRQSRPKKLYL